MLRISRNALTYGKRNLFAATLSNYVKAYHSTILKHSKLDLTQDQAGGHILSNKGSSHDSHTHTHIHAYIYIYICKQLQIAIDSYSIDSYTDINTYRCIH